MKKYRKTAVEKEKLPLIFDRFYRLDNSRNPMTGSHGIGLSLAKAIVNAHGGEIHASLTQDDCFLIEILLSAKVSNFWGAYQLMRIYSMKSL